MRNLIRDLNRVYREKPALHARDCEGEFFHWVLSDASDDSVFAWERTAPDTAPVVVISHFTPIERPGYRIKMPKAGIWREILNTDGIHYGGGGVGNMGSIEAEADGWATVTIPPLATLMLEHVG